VVCFGFGPQRRGQRRGTAREPGQAQNIANACSFSPLTRPLHDGNELVIDGGMIGGRRPGGAEADG
jgi:hypothetical protein